MPIALCAVGAGCPELSGCHVMHRPLNVGLRFLVVVLLQVRPGAVVVRNGAAAAAAAAVKGHFFVVLTTKAEKKEKPTMKNSRRARLTYRVLLYVYGSILVASVVLLFGDSVTEPMVAALVQVTYKLNTPFTVGIINPVVLSKRAESTWRHYIQCIGEDSLRFFTDSRRSAIGIWSRGAAWRSPCPRAICAPRFCVRTPCDT